MLTSTTRKSQIPGRLFTAVGGSIDAPPAVPNPPARADSMSPNFDSKDNLKSVIREINQADPVNSAIKRSKSLNDNNNKIVPDEEAFEDDGEDGDLQLVTKMTFITLFRPSYDRKEWKLESDSAHHVTTYDLETTAFDPNCGYALSELQIMMEHEQCERYYILDEAGGWAAVVCGKMTAFWSGTTPSIRAALKANGIQCSIPLSKGSKLFDMEVGDHPNLARMTSSPGEEKRCTLYFSGLFQVRSMLDAILGISRKDARLRILASHPFPGCMVHVNRMRVTEKFSRRHESKVYHSTMTGYFTQVDIDKIVRGFDSLNGHDNVNVHFEKSPLTKELDEVAREVFPRNRKSEDEVSDKGEENW